MTDKPKPGMAHDGWSSKSGGLDKLSDAMHARTFVSKASSLDRTPKAPPQNSVPTLDNNAKPTAPIKKD